MKHFLSARWLNLINITYAIDPLILLPYLPSGVEPDLINGKALISLVPFQFSETRFLGFRIPFHTSFTELNLRFYVQYKGYKGVVFLREFSSKYAINFIANHFYKEHYNQAALKATIREEKDELEVTYRIYRKNISHCLSAKALKKTFIPSKESLEYFLEHRFYGFSGDKKGDSFLFKVEHPEWDLYTLYDYKVDIDFTSLFGKEWAFLGKMDPVCAMLIRGSEVKMYPHLSLRKVAPVNKTLSPAWNLFQQ